MKINNIFTPLFTSRHETSFIKPLKLKINQEISQYQLQLLKIQSSTTSRLKLSQILHQITPNPLQIPSYFRLFCQISPNDFPRKFKAS